MSSEGQVSIPASPSSANKADAPRRKKGRGSYPAHIRYMAAFVILMRELTVVSRAMLSRFGSSSRDDRLIPLTYRQDRPGLEDPDIFGERQQFWKELVKAAEASPAEQIAQAEAVRRLVRVSDREVVELKLAHRGGSVAQDNGEEVTAFFRFEDSAGPIGFAAIEQHGSEALLHSVFLLAHRRGAGAGSDLVAQVMAAAKALGIDRVWLLTATASPFFAKLGFESTVRRKLPNAIARSPVVRSAPDSAACMVIDIELDS